MMSDAWDAVVVGAGPNGLAAAITLARAGRSVLVLEGASTVGGGARTAELTLPGFRHDVCSAIDPLAVASRFFRQLPDDLTGIRWIHAPAPLAHPFDDGTVVMLERSITETAVGLGGDGPAYRRLFEPLTAGALDLVDDLLGPLRAPKHPLLAARFGVSAMRSAVGFARTSFEGARARALFAGVAAHVGLPLDQIATAATGLVLMMLAHAAGWPLPRGGSQSVADGLAAYLSRLGGEIQTNTPIRDLADLPPADLLLFDTAPAHLVSIARPHLAPRYIRQLDRVRYGPGVFKVDYALDGPIPWRASECARAATVHLGGPRDDNVSAAAAVGAGRVADRPFIILCQQSLFDPDRAPAGKQTVWAYCHVPLGSPVDMTERIDTQIDRFAPGFRGRILARSIIPPHALEAYNPNAPGGAIDGGAMSLRQLYFRPRPVWRPYRNSNPRVYLCSASTPPGGGVHGLCGYYAARTALYDVTARPARL
jgi:phytoene dehydrogenase-like protein